MTFPNANLFPFTAEVDVRGRLALGGCDAVDLAAEFGRFMVPLGRSMITNITIARELGYLLSLIHI